MQQYRFEVFDERALRLYGPDGKLSDQRELSPAEIAEFVSAVEEGYKVSSPDLPGLGRRLYEWLDGPNERWLADACDGNVSLAIHIDVEKGLRHLPWELLATDGVYLCTNPLRPFTPVRRVGKGQRTVKEQNRPLRVLMMACSPLDVQPVLDFENEERLILEATLGQPIELVVEESGSLRGLTERIESVGHDYYDVFHLTGHANVIDDKPIFLMEDDYGRRQNATAEQIALAFQGRWPRLIFLSGCKTGQAADQGVLPSMCERMVTAGAPAVLGWALPVYDETATIAAKELYHHLAVGHRNDESTGRARQKLYAEELTDWHLLRLYADATPLTTLVTPLNTLDREELHVRHAREQFLDAGAKMEVCPRELFVGRRRIIQRCLRVLRAKSGMPKHHEGVLLYGMGGLGKSSLAARLCERMSGHKLVVCVGLLDEVGFLGVVSDGLDDAKAIKTLNTPDLSLKARLRILLTKHPETTPLMFVFDDFESNLDDAEDGTKIAKPAALEVLKALLGAIRETASDSRVLVTCRYDFPLPGPARLYREALESMRGAELDKMLALLPQLKPGAATARALREQATELAAGNPRLLERLDKVLADEQTDQEAVLLAMGQVADEFREDVLLRALLEQQAAEARKLLALLAVYSLPVDREAVEAVATGVAVDPHLGRAAAVGLVEAGLEPGLQTERYHVSRILLPLLEGELSDKERLEACARAARHLYEAWWDLGEGVPETRALEIHRLAMQGGEKAIAVQVGDPIATRWVNRSRFAEAELLCRVTLGLGEAYRILHTLARAEEVLGKTDDAQQHYEQALGQCPAADSGATEEITRVRAAIVNNLAGLVARQGDVKRALELWNESLKVCEQVGNVGGKAATLAQMASAAGKQKDHTRERELNLQAAEALASIRAWVDLITVLNNLGVADEAEGAGFLAQAVWLAVHVEAPVDHAVSVAGALLARVGVGAECGPLVATTGNFLAETRGKDHPKQEELQQQGLAMLAACAEARKVPPEKFNEWVKSERLNEPNHFLPALDRALEEIVGDDGWLFDRASVGKG